jgi:hypothetical protein
MTMVLFRHIFFMYHRKQGNVSASDSLIPKSTLFTTVIILRQGTRFDAIDHQMIYDSNPHHAFASFLGVLRLLAHRS